MSKSFNSHFNETICKRAKSINKKYIRKNVLNSIRTGLLVANILSKIPQNLCFAQEQDKLINVEKKNQFSNKFAVDSVISETKSMWNISIFLLNNIINKQHKLTDTKSRN